MNAKTIGALAATLIAGTAFLAAPAANAASITAGTIVAAEQAGTVIAQDQSSQVTATPSAPRAITVTTEPGSVVTVTPKAKTAKAGQQSKTANKDGRATFTTLNAGTTYTVTANGRSTTVVPVVKVAKASDLTVMTTDRVGTVDLTWQHKATKAQGEVGYTVTATPANTAQDIITTEASSTQAELTGLDPNAVYSFSVTPHNPLGNGKASVARMSRSLAAITGMTGSGSTTPVALDDSKGTTPAATPSPAPNPGPAPTPSPAPKPNTRTIYVCPDGWDDVNGVCTQTRGYTFHTETETSPYTYSADRRYESCWGGDCPGSEYKDFGTDWSGTTCPNGGTMHDGKCMGWTEGHTWVTYQVKDAPPMGWYDNGSAYAKDVQVKDATPAGWSDNGSEWIRTTAKIEKVVPA